MRVLLIQARFQWLKRCDRKNNDNTTINRLYGAIGLNTKNNGPASWFIAQSYHKEWCVHNYVPCMRKGQWSPNILNWFLFSMMVCYCLSAPSCRSQGRNVTMWSLISTWLWQDCNLFVQTSRTSSKPSNALGDTPIIGFLLRSTALTNIGVNARGWTESIAFLKTHKNTIIIINVG